jgi:hypothetical protein
LFSRPLDFVKNIDNGKHVVIFYEDIEYARTIILKYIENGLLNSEQCFLISVNEDKKFIEREIQESINEISSKIIDINEYIKYSLLYVGNIFDIYNYPNTILRDALPNCSIICSYPINDILSTIKGESSIYSEWMADLLEIYDAVIYARRYWKGAAFNLI